MIKTQRLDMIRSLLQERHTLTIDELVVLLDTTVPTLHRDLDQLEAEGVCRKVHGGVHYLNRLGDEPQLTSKLTAFTAEKDQIGKMAASLVQPGETIYLDAGTTTIHIIPYLANKDVKVFTNGVTHIEALLKYHIDFFIVGGYVKHSTQAIVGDEAVAFIQKYYFDRAFIGANGIDQSVGFTTPDLREGHLKRIAIQSARKAYIVADHSKFEQVYLVKIAPLDGVTLITDHVPDDYRALVKTEGNE